MFLGIPYCTGYQSRFETALAQGELEKAFRILESIPTASKNDVVGNRRRNIILAKGYRELAKAFLRGKGENAGGLQGRLDDYQSLGTLDELKSKLEILTEYQDIHPSPSDAQIYLELLHDYQTLGTVKEILSQKKELERLQEQFEEIQGEPVL